MRLRLVRLVFAACAFALAGAISAQPFPSKPIRIVVPFAAGSATDTMARAYGAEMQNSRNRRARGPCPLEARTY